MKNPFEELDACIGQVDVKRAFIPLDEYPSFPLQ